MTAGRRGLGLLFGYAARSATGDQVCMELGPAAKTLATLGALVLLAHKLGMI
jgi:hypothetical protein